MAFGYRDPSIYLNSDGPVEYSPPGAAIKGNPKSPSRSKAPRRMNPKAEPYIAPEQLPEPTVDYSSQQVPELPHDVVVYIVRSFACWTPAPEIATALLREFGIKVLPFQLYRFDPERPAGQDLDEELVNLHADAREEYRNAVSDIPIANRVFRMRELQKMYDRANSELNSNPKVAMQALEQAAKESADYWKRAFSVEHTGAGGAPLPPAINITFTDPKAVFAPPVETIDVTPEVPLLPEPE